MAMYELGLADQMILVALWVGLIYGLFGLAMAYLALTDLEWRQLIQARLKAEWRGLRLRLLLAWLNLISLALGGFEYLFGIKVRR